MTNKEIGKYGEKIAKNFLIKRGFEILNMNWHYSRMSEIDIIASKDGILHFVEVKTRSNDKFGMPLEAVNKRKLNYIFQGALAYASKLAEKYKRIQIDAIGIMLFEDKEPEIKFIENISL